MNWRKSNAELSALLERAPFLYLTEWRERLDRCVAHLQPAEDYDLGQPDEVRLTTDSLRLTAEWLLAVADRLDGAAVKRARIAALRDTTGRTPEEALAYQTKADELEAIR